MNNCQSSNFLKHDLRIRIIQKLVIVALDPPNPLPPTFQKIFSSKIRLKIPIKNFQIYVFDRKIQKINIDSNDSKFIILLD